MGKPCNEGRMVTLRLDAITLDPRLQCRASIDMATVDEYAEAIKAGATRDGKPPRIFEDRARNVYWCADGWHWWHGSAKAGKKSMDCFVVPGSFQDALRYAVGANATHGRPRTNEDKRRAIMACLEEKELENLSTREIAELCKVSRDLAERVRKDYNSARNVEEPATRIGKDGKPQAASKSGGRSATTEEPAADLPEELGDATAADAEQPDELEDAKGRPIPARLVPVFSDAKFLSNLVQGLGHLVTEAKQFHENHKAGAFLSVQSVQIAVQNLQAALSTARPFIVCPACSGTLTEGGIPDAPPCKVCRSDGEPQGWLPAGKWSALSHDLKTVAEGFKKGDAYEGE